MKKVTASRAQRREAFLTLAGQAFDELEAWYEAHPEATFGEIEAQARAVRRELMGQGLGGLINQRSHTVEVHAPNCPCLTSVNDGAAWIERITQTNFPNAVQIVDWAHAAQHVYATAQLNWPSQTDTAIAWSHAQLDELWRGDPLAVASAIALLASTRAAQSASYFSDNASRMRYADFRARGLPIGSGSVESAGKTVIQHRLKRPCRGWTRANASAMIAALCELHSHRLDAISRLL